MLSSSDVKIEGESIVIAPSVILHPKVSILSSPSSSVSIGERCIVEEQSLVVNSKIGNNNILEVGSTVSESTIGDSCILGIKCSVKNSVIGNGCFISATVQLEGAQIPDNTSVYMVNGKWVSRPVDISILEPQLVGYYDKISNPNSAHYIPQTFAEQIKN